MKFLQVKASARRKGIYQEIEVLALGKSMHVSLIVTEETGYSGSGVGPRYTMKNSENISKENISPTRSIFFHPVQYSSG